MLLAGSPANLRGFRLLPVSDTTSSPYRAKPEDIIRWRYFQYQEVNDRASPPQHIPPQPAGPQTMMQKLLFNRSWGFCWQIKLNLSLGNTYEYPKYLRMHSDMLQNSAIVHSDQYQLIDQWKLDSKEKQNGQGNVKKKMYALSLGFC